MTYSQKTTVRWDQSAFEALQDSWSAERVFTDRKKLAAIFNLAAEAPLLKEALDWAEAHGVQIFVDRTVDDLGYYAGAGIVAVSDKIIDAPETVIGTIVHEIRHAWQDYHGFTAEAGPDQPPEDFAHYFINSALVEADAEAYAQRAEAQFRAAASPKILPDEKADLATNFLSWFSEHNLGFYGEYISKYLGQKWGVYNGPPPEHHQEFHVESTAPSPGIDTSHINRVLRLGMGFSSGTSYFARLPQDILAGVLSPSEANAFYGAASPEQKELTADIRKVSLQAKLTPKNP